MTKYVKHGHMLQKDLGMTDGVLLYKVENGIAHITLNRPEKLNALDGALADALRETWASFEADPAVQVGILKGAGRAFCAGRDLTPGAVDPNTPFQTHRAHPDKIGSTSCMERGGQYV